MKITRKNLQWWISGLLVIVLVVLLFIPKDNWVNNEPSQVTIEADYISFDQGYWKGVNDMLVYFQENNYLRNDTSISIHMEDLIEMNNKQRELYMIKMKSR